MWRGWVAAAVAIVIAGIVLARSCGGDPERVPEPERVRVTEHVAAPRLATDDAPRAPRHRPTEPSTRVSGLVIRADTRAPVAGATVELRAEGSVAFEATTDDTGRFVAEGLQPRSYEVTARAPSLATRLAVEVQPDVGAPVDDVTCELVAAYRIEGRVVDATGHGAEGAYLALSATGDPAGLEAGPRSVRSEPDGRFVFPHVPAGTYDASAFARVAGTLRLEVRGDLTDVVLRIPEPPIPLPRAPRMRGLVEGRIIDEQGRPLAGAHVVFVGPDETLGAGDADEEGRFRITGLDAPGTYTYRVYDRVASHHVLAPLRPTVEPAVVLPAWRAQLTGLVLRVHDERVAIAGRVVDEHGAPVEGIAVRATTVPHADGWPAVTDPAGAFELRDLSPGRYWLRAVAPTGVAIHEPVEAGATNVRLVVARHGGIAGTLEGLPGAVVRVRGPEEGFEVSRLAAVTGDRFEVRGLAAGTYSLEAYGGEARAWARVLVEPGVATELVVRAEVPADDRPLPPPPPPP